MNPFDKDLDSDSLVRLYRSLKEAESVQFKSKGLVITTKDHEIKKIAKEQLNTLVLDLARNNDLSPEEKLKLLEKTKDKLNKLSQKRTQSNSNHRKKGVIENIDSVIEFVKQKSNIEEELCLETSKVGEWFKEVCSCDIEKIGDYCIPKIHAYLLQKVPLSCYLDKEAWYEIVNREFIASFRKLVPLTPWDDCHYFLPRVGDLNLEIADPLPMTKFDEEFQSHLLSKYRSLDNFIASKAVEIIDFYKPSEKDEQTRLRWTNFCRDPSEILETIEAIYTHLDIDNLITSLQIQLQECQSLIPEQMRNSGKLDTISQTRRYSPYVDRCEHNQAAIQILTSYRDFVTNQVAEGEFNLIRALTDFIREKNESPETVYRQSDTTARLPFSGSKKIKKIEKKFNGLCEIICNKILLDNMLGDDKFYSYLKNEMTLNKLDQPQFVDTHILETAKALDLAKFVLLNRIPGSALTSSDRRNICKREKINGKNRVTIDEAIFERVLDRIEVDKPMKIFIYTTLDRKVKKLINGHSLLMMKTGPDSFIFFDPNHGRFRDLTKDKLKEKIEQSMNELQLSKILIADAQLLIDKYKPKKK